MLAPDGAVYRPDIGLLILFSALVLFIVVAGTVWVLGDLGYRMMPGMMPVGME